MAWMLVRLFLRKKQAQQVRSNGFMMNLKRGLRALCYLFNVHTLVLMTLSCLAVYLCDRLNWSYNQDFSMIATGTVFPLTFTLSQAFTRRERATSLIANLKASVVALYFMHRDWDQSAGYPASLGNDDIPSAIAAKSLLMELLVNIRRYLTSPSPFESLAEARLTASQHEFLSSFEHDMHLSDKSRVFRKVMASLTQSDPSPDLLRNCYKCLSRLSVLNEKLTLSAGYTRGGEGGLSRTNQYLRYIISNLEELRTLKDYRTPTMMRHAVGVLFHIFAIVLAPYYCHFCNNHDEDGLCAPAYASACAYVLIVMLLHHIQQDMENCLDEKGLDDAFFDVPDEVDKLAGAAVLHSARSSMSDMAHLLQGSSPKGRRSMDFGNTMGSQSFGGLQERKALRTIPSDKALPDLEASPLMTSQSSHEPAIAAGWGRPTQSAHPSSTATLSRQSSGSSRHSPTSLAIDAGSRGNPGPDHASSCPGQLGNGSSSSRSLSPRSSLPRP